MCVGVLLLYLLSMYYTIRFVVDAFTGWIMTFLIVDTSLKVSYHPVYTCMQCELVAYMSLHDIVILVSSLNILTPSVMLYIIH